MSENKMCNHCNKFTADEIVKGDVFCIECGHQRGTSPQQEQANKAREGKEKRKRSWHKWIWLIIGLSLASATKQLIGDNIKARRAEELKKHISDARIKLVRNALNLPAESIQQLADLTEKARSLITNNLTGQDKANFIRFSGHEGMKLTPDEAIELGKLMEKSKSSMSAEDREIVERFQRETKKLMK